MGVYWAMTDLELCRCLQPPAGCAWMACHFSSADSGLSNLPDSMPEHGLLCIDDSLLPQQHDAKRIAQQVLELYERFSLAGIVLDFQRKYFSELNHIALELQGAVPCPVAVTPPYTADWPGAVFLPPVPLHQAVSDYLSGWQGRDIWLEIDCDKLSMALTKEGCRCEPTEEVLQEPVFQDASLHCHYSIRLTADAAVFTLGRTWDDILSLIEDGRQYGVTNAVGLYQELGSIYGTQGIQ